MRRLGRALGATRSCRMARRAAVHDPQRVMWPSVLPHRLRGDADLQLERDFDRRSDLERQHRPRLRRPDWCSRPTMRDGTLSEFSRDLTSGALTLNRYDCGWRGVGAHRACAKFLQRVPLRGELGRPSDSRVQRRYRNRRAGRDRLGQRRRWAVRRSESRSIGRADFCTSLTASAPPFRSTRSPRTVRSPSTARSATPASSCSRWESRRRRAAARCTSRTSVRDW